MSIGSALAAWAKPIIVAAAEAAAKEAVDEATARWTTFLTALRVDVVGAIGNITTDVDGEVKAVVADVDALAEKIIAGVIADLPDVGKLTGGLL